MRGKLLKRYDVTFQERGGGKVKTQKQDDRKIFFFLNVHETVFCYLSRVIKSLAIRTQKNDCSLKKGNNFQVLLADFKEGFKMSKKQTI